MDTSFIPPPKSPVARKTSQPISKSVNTKSIMNDKTSRKPKRPLSVYNIFFREERKRILASISDDDSHTEEIENCEDEDEDEQKMNTLENRPKRGRPRGPKYMKKIPHHKIGFEDLARKISSSWSLHKVEYYEKYGKTVEEDKKRYKEEMAEYKKQLKEVQVERSKAIANVNRTKTYTTDDNFQRNTMHGNSGVYENHTAHRHRNQIPSRHYSIANSDEVNEFYSHLHYPENQINSGYDVMRENIPNDGTSYSYRHSYPRRNNSHYYNNYSPLK